MKNKKGIICDEVLKRINELHKKYDWEAIANFIKVFDNIPKSDIKYINFRRKKDFK